MSVLVLFFLLAVVGLVVVAGVVVGAVALARRSQAQFAAANELVPGTPSAAPASWAGAHSPEALLHRRLVAALSGLRTVEAATGGSLDAGGIDLRVQLELRADDLDRRLVAAAALPPTARQPALAVLASSVGTVEDVAGALGQRLAVGGATPDAPALETLGQQLRALDAPPA